jgi:hypothetical protein
MHAEIWSPTMRPVFFWNVGAPVGLNGTNNFDDVLFVQWCFYKLSKWEQTPPDLRPIFAKTPVNGACTGRAGDLLIASIEALQRADWMRGAVVDGRISVPKAGGHYKYHGGKHTFMIFYLNAALRKMHPQQYPRIDLMPDFIWRIRDQATAPFI